MTNVLPLAWRGGTAASTWIFPAICAGMILALGCAGRPDFEPAPLQAEGWRQMRGQLVWRPSANGPEVVGDILLARGPAGEQVVEFSKGIPIMTARSGAGGWLVDVAARNIKRSGRGKPPKVGWFLVAEAAFDARVSARGWKLEAGADGGWTLERPRTGERFEYAPGDD